MTTDEATQILKDKLRDLTTNPMACIMESEYMQALAVVIHAVDNNNGGNKND